MKIRTHFTIENGIMDKAKEDARRMGLSLSSYVGLLMVERLNRLEREKIEETVKGLPTVEVDDEELLRRLRDPGEIVNVAAKNLTQP